MSTEEKTTSTLETTELPKPKRRFKLDKKHIQGFIAGILVAAIAFTGLYYGTDGRFFKGMFGGNIGDNCNVVIDTNFEDVVIKSKLPVLVVFYSSQSSANRNFYLVAWDTARHFDGIIKFAFINVDEAPGATAKNNVKVTPSCLLLKGGTEISRKERLGLMTKDELYDWVSSWISALNRMS